MEEDHDEASIHAVSRRKLMYPLSNHIKIGIIGTTNVGKSTLFNIFSKSNGRRAEVDDCLFCTIDPSISTINTPDDKFEWLQGLWNPKHSSRTKVSVTDTAGIVAGSYLEVRIIEKYRVEPERVCHILTLLYYVSFRNLGPHTRIMASVVLHSMR